MASGASAATTSGKGWRAIESALSCRHPSARNDNMNRWQIGDVKITRVVEMETVSKATFVLHDATPENIQREPWLQPHFAEPGGRVRMSIHALIVESDERRIVVDTCLGNDKRRENPPW